MRNQARPAESNAAAGVRDAAGPGSGDLGAADVRDVAAAGVRDVAKSGVVDMSGSGVGDAAGSGGSRRARVVGLVFDVADPDAAHAVAEAVGEIDIVFGNAVMRVGPQDEPRAIIDEYTQVNNFGTTRLLRAFGARVRPGGRMLIVASSLGTLRHLAPVLHGRFDGLGSLDEVDAATARWRDEVADGRAQAMAWPGFVNIPSKIAQVAAVRAVAAVRRDILVAAVCPGMINTPTSGLWWDVRDAASPAQAAEALLDLALGEIDPTHHGELVRFGQVVPWK
ncbi:carbonyl reductase [Dactylosporangium matsuzakiense]|uniref:carbonyl reductase n=1 Tax=Dactylosporangium matsuzakiense TaxID=53360 RepID=UPI0021C36632|nr:carbonyl reductase [Dactylosporangium matsuzakiense]UWZ43266.1 carbonyl reductase [Dactylosporangium matsuzakiense]